MPVPVSVTLYNLFPPVQQEAAKSRLFRPEHTTELLLPIKLQILLKGDREQTVNDERILYTSLLVNHSLHPIWDHLNERVQAWNNDRSEWVDQELPILRITVFDADDTPIPVADDVPLDPKLLRRLPRSERETEAFWGQQRPPKSLPPNAILVQYSDGSVRVDPALYRLLVQKAVFTDHELMDTSILKEDEEEKRRAARFQDNIFDVLGDADEEKYTPQNSLLETDDEALASPVRRADGQLETATITDDLRLPEGTMDQLVDGGIDGQEGQASKLPTEFAASIDDLLKEREELEALIEREQALLGRDLELLEMVSSTWLKHSLSESNRIPPRIATN